MHFIHDKYFVIGGEKWPGFSTHPASIAMWCCRPFIQEVVYLPMLLIQVIVSWFIQQTVTEVRLGCKTLCFACFCFSHLLSHPCHAAGTESVQSAGRGRDTCGLPHSETELLSWTQLTTFSWGSRAGTRRTAQLYLPKVLTHRIVSLLNSCCPKPQILEWFVLQQQITDIHLLKYDGVPTLWHAVGTQRWLSRGPGSAG